MTHLYSIGQYVYTNRDIRGWFDYSMKEFIPANTIGIIMSVGHHDLPEELYYLVKFLNKNEEFGTQYIHEASLKVG
jgi:hypothetical protein